jgi:hypothetical protein
MTVRCIRSRAAVGLTTAILAAAAMTFPGVAFAAGSIPGAPTQLLPTPKAKEAPPPADVVPASPEAGSSETAIGGIRVDELAPIAPQTDAVGTIDGLGPDLWRGTSRATVATYLPRLPLPASSPAVRGLADKILLTSGTMPPAAPGGISENLLTLRLDRLKAMGDVDDFAALARAIPNANDEMSVRARVEAAFLTGDDGTACAEVSAPDRPAAFSGEFWTHAATVCDLIAGRTAQAQLALDVISEQGGPANAPFSVLLRAALGDRTPIADLAGVGPIEAALLRVSKTEVTPAALANASALALRTVALGASALPVRLEAAEKAEALGAISSAKLGEIYAAVPFKPDELANALTQAGNDLSPRGRALFFKAAEQARSVPAAGAEVLKAALDSAREQGRFAQTARLYAADIAAIDPAPELLWFTENAARALYSVGSVARAEEWRALAARGSDSAAVDTALWPWSSIAAISAGNAVAAADASTVPLVRAHAAFDPAAFDRWLASLPEADRPAKGAAALTLLDALGASVPAESWAPFLDAAGSMRSSPLLAPLARAADAGRVGETVLLSLTVLGSGDSDKWAPETTSAALSALMRVNLSADAQALAFEAAVAAGL